MKKNGFSSDRCNPAMLPDMGFPLNLRNEIWLQVRICSSDGSFQCHPPIWGRRQTTNCAIVAILQNVLLFCNFIFILMTLEMDVSVAPWTAGTSQRSPAASSWATRGSEGVCVCGRVCLCFCVPGSPGTDVISPWSSSFPLSFLHVDEQFFQSTRATTCQIKKKKKKTIQTCNQNKQTSKSELISATLFYFLSIKPNCFWWEYAIVYTQSISICFL